VCIGRSRFVDHAGYSRLSAKIHGGSSALWRKDTPAPVTVAKEDERYGAVVGWPFYTHEPVLPGATVDELRDAYSVRHSNPLINKRAQRCS
jgi:hypothetical protein